MKVKKGDNVYVAKGRDAGKTGKVVRVLRETDRIIVEGTNLYKKHVRPKRQGEKGQVVELSRSMSSANVLVVCTACKKPTRIGYRTEGDTKSRVCKRCSAAIN